MEISWTEKASLSVLELRDNIGDVSEATGPVNFGSNAII
jgi:hypothetical protein